MPALRSDVRFQHISQYSHTGHEHYNNILESELHQHVNNPTRDNNILALVLFTSEDLVTDLKVGLEFSTSGHRLITFKVKMKNKLVNRSNEKVPDFRRAAFVKLRNLLANSDWSNMFIARDINKSCKIFQIILNGAVNQYVPSRIRRKQVNKKQSGGMMKYAVTLLLKSVRMIDT